MSQWIGSGEDPGSVQVEILAILTKMFLSLNYFLEVSIRIMIQMGTGKLSPTFFQVICLLPFSDSTLNFFF